MSEATFESTDRLAVTDRHVAVDVQDEVMILGVDSGTYFSVDSVGRDIWQLVQTPCTFQSICERLISEYDVDPAECETEVRGFLGTLLERGLIQRV